MFKFRIMSIQKTSFLLLLLTIDRSNTNTKQMN